MTEIPASVYAVVGIMIITNLTAIGTLVVFIFKCGVFVADTKSGIADAKAAAVRAHLRIDEINQTQ